MSALNDNDRANLVAYLDGELDAESSRALEAKLNLDPQARAEAETLRRTWELLDYLPRPEPSPSFTNRTLEKLVVQHVTGAQPAARRRRWPVWLFGVGWAAALLVAAAGGLGAAHLLWSRDAGTAHEPAEIQDLMVRNPRVVEHKRVFEHVDDFDFLRKLDDPELFGDEEPGS
jgi:anti-sigma factor RsiW